MLALVDLQQAFTDWVLREGNPVVSDLIKANGLTTEQRLNVYRNNTQLGLTEALRDGYQVVNKLVGEAFFNRMARDYIRLNPPKAGCLLYFGETFASFIKAYPPASTLPYLPDVARLEWFWHEAFHEADAKPLVLTGLAKVAAEQYGQLFFELHPSVRLLASDYPVLRIWQSNQDDYQGSKAIDLSEGCCQVLVFRPQWDVLMLALTKPELCFLAALQQGKNLSQAAEQALTQDNSFSLLDILQRGFGMGLFSGYATSLNEE
jgi:hypothetical protein